MKSSEKFERLIAAYPKLFNKDSVIINQRGIECGDGWFDLVSTACSILQFGADNNPVALYPEKVWDEASRSWETRDVLKHPQVTMLQIKEKFGRLTIYMKNASEYQYAQISALSSHSSRVCETCGKPGTMQNNGWMYVACEEHVRSS